MKSITATVAMLLSLAAPALAVEDCDPAGTSHCVTSNLLARLDMRTDLENEIILEANTPAWLFIVLGVVAAFGVTALALSFVKALVIFGAIGAGGFLFLVGVVLWGCLELRNL